jgi:hypothetical protein
MHVALAGKENPLHKLFAKNFIYCLHQCDQTVVLLSWMIQMFPGYQKKTKCAENKVSGVVNPEQPHLTVLVSNPRQSCLYIQSLITLEDHS